MVLWRQRRRRRLLLRIATAVPALIAPVCAAGLVVSAAAITIPHVVSISATAPVSIAVLVLVSVASCLRRCRAVPQRLRAAGRSHAAATDSAASAAGSARTGGCRSRSPVVVAGMGAVSSERGAACVLLRRVALLVGPAWRRRRSARRRQLPLFDVHRGAAAHVRAGGKARQLRCSGSGGAARAHSGCGCTGRRGASRACRPLAVCRSLARARARVGAQRPCVRSPPRTPRMRGEPGIHTYAHLTPCVLPEATSVTGWLAASRLERGQLWPHAPHLPCPTVSPRAHAAAQRAQLQQCSKRLLPRQALRRTARVAAQAPGRRLLGCVAAPAPARAAGYRIHGGLLQPAPRCRRGREGPRSRDAAGTPAPRSKQPSNVQ
jgi:hypothetical protein